MNTALCKGNETYLFWPSRNGKEVKVLFRDSTRPESTTDIGLHTVKNVAAARSQYRTLLADGFTRNAEIERFYADVVWG